MSISRAIAAAAVIGLLTSGSAFARGGSSGGGVSGHASAGHALSNAGAGRFVVASLGQPGRSIRVGAIQAASRPSAPAVLQRGIGGRGASAFDHGRPHRNRDLENGGPPSGSQDASTLGDASNVSCLQPGVIDPQASDDGMPIVIYGSVPKCGPAGYGGGPGVYRLQ